MKYQIDQSGKIEENNHQKTALSDGFLVTVVGKPTNASPTDLSSDYQRNPDLSSPKKRVLNNSINFVIPASSWNLYRFRVKHGMTNGKYLLNTLKNAPVERRGFEPPVSVGKTVGLPLAYRPINTGACLLLQKIIFITIAFLFLLAKPALAANSGIFTISAWVKPETSVVNKAIVGKAEELRVFTDGSGYVGCQIMSSSSWQTGASSASALTLNSWNHIACTYDKVKLTIYINGSQISQTSLTVSPDDTANSLKYGIDNSASTPYSAFKGTIDELKIYNYARTQKQIIEDMNAGHPAGGSPVGSQVAKYNFDEGYGTNTKNSVAVGATSATLFLGAGASAPSWSNDGKYGKALSFDGGGDYAYTANTAMMAGNGQTYPTLAISAWVYPQSSAVSKTILNKNSEFKITTDANSKINCSIYVAGAWSTAAVTSSALSLNSWTHVLCNYDGVNIKVWTNGTNLANSTNVGNTAQIVSLNTTPLNIAKDATALANYQGLIDEVKIYNYSLSQDEILVDYNQGKALQLGSLSTGSSNPASSSAGSQEYCVPGDTTTNCSPPVGRWDFNEGVGTSAYDSSGNGNNGVLGAGTSAPTWSTGKIGKGLRFDGSNDYVVSGDAPTLDISGTASLTQEAWIKTTSKPASSNYNVITTITETGQGSGAFDKGLMINPNGYADFYVWASAAKHTTGTTDVADGRWHHLVGLYDGTNIKVYVDGKIEGTPTVATSTYDFTSPQLVVSFNEGTIWKYFPGLIDQVKIYNYARTPAQIAWDYNQGKPIAYYDFDKCQGTVLEDAIGPRMTGSTAFNGTITIGSLGTQSSAGTCNLGVGSSTAWGNGTTGKYNSSLNFDGTDDYVTIGTGTTVQSVSLWVKPTTNNVAPLQLATGVGISAASGVISAPGFTSPTIYVNGIPGSTLTAGTWQMVTVTTATGIPATAIKFGLFGTTYYSGQIDEAKIWNYQLTAVQVKTEFNQAGAVRFGPDTGSP